MIRRRPPVLASEPQFDLHVGELVIEGFPPDEGRAIVAALEQELGRILGDGTAPFADARSGREHDGLSVDRLDAGTVMHAPDAAPRVVGQSAARAIVQRLRTLSSGHDPAPARKVGT
jgi:hypothetical protein